MPSAGHSAWSRHPPSRVWRLVRGQISSYSSLFSRFDCLPLCNLAVLRHIVLLPATDARIRHGRALVTGHRPPPHRGMLHIFNSVTGSMSAYLCVSPISLRALVANRQRHPNENDGNVMRLNADMRHIVQPRTT